MVKTFTVWHVVLDGWVGLYHMFAYRYENIRRANNPEISQP